MWCSFSGFPHGRIALEWHTWRGAEGCLLRFYSRADGVIA